MNLLLHPLREKFPNREFFLVRIWTLFTQWSTNISHLISDHLIQFVTMKISRSSRPEVFLESAPRNFAKFTGKHLCQSLSFNKVADPRSATLLKKRLWHRCYPVNFAKFLRTPFLTEHVWWLFQSFKFCSKKIRFWFLPRISILIFTRVRKSLMKNTAVGYTRDTMCR